jgi:hypothetical protein
MQSKKQSLKESAVNVAIGYIVALASQLVVFPLVGVQSTFNQNLKIGLYFTVISLVRSYIIRRYFNKSEIPNETKKA